MSTRRTKRRRGEVTLVVLSRAGRRIGGGLPHRQRWGRRRRRRILRRQRRLQRRRRRGGGDDDGDDDDVLSPGQAAAVATWGDDAGALQKAVLAAEGNEEGPQIIPRWEVEGVPTKKLKKLGYRKEVHLRILLLVAIEREQKKAPHTCKGCGLLRSYKYDGRLAGFYAFVLEALGVQLKGSCEGGEGCAGCAKHKNNKHSSPSPSVASKDFKRRFAKSTNQKQPRKGEFSCGALTSARRFKAWKQEQKKVKTAEAAHLPLPGGNAQQLERPRNSGRASADKASSALARLAIAVGHVVLSPREVFEGAPGQ